MTPDEARALLDGTTPGNWQWDVTGNVAAVDGDGWEDVADYVSEPNAPLIVAAPTLAAMIAGMRAEYAVSLPDGQIVSAGWGTYDTAMEDQNAWRTVGYAARIVRRYVTEPEEA